jgi:hypothetical protein
MAECAKGWVARADIEHRLSQRAVLHGPVGF